MQGEDTTLHDALSAVRLASAFYRTQRKDEAFNSFHDDVVKAAGDLAIGQPQFWI